MKKKIKLKNKEMQKYEKSPDGKSPYHREKEQIKQKKLRTFQEELDDRLGIRCRPPTIDHLKDLGDEFVQWCLESIQPDGKKLRRISIERFCNLKLITHVSLWKWRKKCPYLDQCVELGKAIIGDRLEEGLLYKEMSERGVLMNLHHYMPRWKDIEKHEDNRKKDISEMASLLGITINPGELDDSNREVTDRDTDKA